MTEEKQTIFYLEGRGGMYIFHFFVYNLGGLYHILNKEYNNRHYDNSSELLEDKSKIVSQPTTDVSIIPIKIYMKNILPFQREAFEIIKDKFQLVEDLTILENYEIVSIYGETIRQGVPIGENHEKVLPFLRNLFLEKFDSKMIQGKKIFITRKNSEKYHNGILKRFILNEEEFIKMLKKYNFEYIHLEDFSLQDKIKIFMESEFIISSHSGSLTFILFADIKSKIVEIINKGTFAFEHNHYSGIANCLCLNHNLYSNINEDHNGNFTINIKDFEKYLLTLI